MSGVASMRGAALYDSEWRRGAFPRAFLPVAPNTAGASK